jgi:hypothetical protein
MISRSLLATFRHVWDQDPALDRESPNFSFEAFVRTGDLSHVPAKEGQKLTIFELAPLSRRQFQEVIQLRTQERPIDAAMLAVAYGLRGVVNFYDASGQELQVHFLTDGDGTKRVSPATLDQLYDVALLGQLGTRIINESTLRPRNGQG